METEMSRSERLKDEFEPKGIRSSRFPACQGREYLNFSIM